MQTDRELHRLLAVEDAARPTPIVIVVALLVWIALVYGETSRSIAAIWDRSETFAHGFVIVPIVLYLLWRDRDRLRAIDPRPYLPALLGLVLLGTLWLVATRIAVNSVAQFAMVAMIPCAAWAVLGTRAWRTLAFPFAFLFFAVPFGEFLMPALMEWTADVTIAALRASGIAVYREGNFFTIPSGRWSVVEACSGLRYLIASFMVGCLFAYLSFRSPWRRAMFVIASIAVPIVANWVRAYMIVMLGHLSGNRIAVGADHLLYGWVFFGIVMGVLFWIGARWREDTVPPPQGSDRPAIAPALPAASRTVWRTLAACLIVTAAFPLLAAVWARGTEGDGAGGLAEIPASNGWNPAPVALSHWRPDIAGVTSWQAQTFRKDDASVALIVAYYDVVASPKAISSTNQLVRTANKEWAQVAAGSASLEAVAASVTVRTAVIVRGSERFAVWQWYWIGGRVTASDMIAKTHQAVGILLGRREPVAWIVLATPTERGEEEARATLARFAADMQPSIDAALRRASGG